MASKINIKNQELLVLFVKEDTKKNAKTRK